MAQAIFLKVPSKISFTSLKPGGELLELTLFLHGILSNKKVSELAETFEKG